MSGTKSQKSLIFQPALPMRGVTYIRRKYYGHSVFQPALPMRGVTQPVQVAYQLDKFQPALPMRGVTAILCAKFTASINI